MGRPKKVVDINTANENQEFKKSAKKSEGFSILRNILPKLEQAEQDIEDARQYLKDIYGELKAHGISIKVLRRLMKERKQDQGELFEEISLMNHYRQALGMEIITAHISNNESVEDDDNEESVHEDLGYKKAK